MSWVPGDAGRLGGGWAAAEEVLERLRLAEPRCGSIRVVCVDGPAGSGKTTLADLVAAGTGAGIVRLDDLYEGWEQPLGKLAARIEAWLLVPWRDDLPGLHPVYDWASARFSGWRRVDPRPVMVLDGCGSASAGMRPWAALTVWVEAGPDVRLARGIARDGGHLEAEWLAWQAREARHFAEDGTRECADTRVDGESGAIIGP